MTKPKVLVLGCGPNGLIAAWGAHNAGGVVRILSKNRKSHMYGAQYLHAPIQGLDPGPTQKVRYLLKGTPAEYRAKVYGDDWDGTVSPMDLDAQHDAWDIRHAYDQLWDMSYDAIEDAVLSPASIQMAIDNMKPDLVVSTVPAPVLCTGEHFFKDQEIIAAGEAPDLGIKLPYYCDEGTVICNGSDEVSWYRLSNIFGHKTVEWPNNVKPPFSGTAVVKKPLSHNCTCFPDILRVGRYGAWQKGYLAHQTFGDVYDVVRMVAQ